MTHLSKDDLDWINNPKSNMSGTFVSDSGCVSKLLFTSFSIANSSNPFYLSSGSDDYYEANAWYDYEIKDSKRTLKEYLGVARLIGEDSLCAVYGLGVMSSIDNYKRLKHSLFKTKNRNYNSCLIIDTTMVKVPERKRDSTHLMVDKFVLSKKYGPIYYKLKSGEEFYRKF